MSSENNVKGLVRAPTMGRLRMLAATAPAIFIAHALEEGPGFVQWFNAHVARGITPGLFWTVNLVGLALTLTLAVCAIAWNAPSGTSDVLLLAWLSFLFGANAALHMVAALVDRAYVPGLVTAVVLYAPFYVLLVRETFLARRIGGLPMTVIALVGSTPMLAHGYLIVFRGSRLF